jgi:hypothetical protein
MEIEAWRSLSSPDLLSSLRKTPPKRAVFGIALQTLIVFDYSILEMANKVF